MSLVSQNLVTIHERIAAAAERAGRDPQTITLIAVSKTMPPERVDEAVAAGQMVFGENRVQEAKAKIPLVSSRACWHLVGHLQSNKARDAVRLFDLIHSVDSVKLARELDRSADRIGKSQPILLEVNVAGEKSKFGFPPGHVEAALEEINSLARLETCGLMTIAPYADDPEKVRPYFRQLRGLCDRLGLSELSMGMTGDFEVAIEEGATMVRVGTGVFGEREKP